MNRENDFDKFWSNLEVSLKEKLSTNIVFNQYRDCNDKFDIHNAANIRLQNLREYIFDVIKTASILIVGEASGPWGCRFSGVPFTGEKQLLDDSFPIKGDRSSKITKERRDPFTSKTATIFWEIMLPYYNKFLAWDALPYHSYKEGAPLTVRNPGEKEILQYKDELNLVKDYLNPEKIIAVGRNAECLLKSLGENAIYVRHPSRGGKKEFSDGIQKHFGNNKLKSKNTHNIFLRENKMYLGIDEFENYVKKNAEKNTYHTVKRTPFKFKLLNPKTKISEFSYTIKFYSANWSKTTVRQVGPKDVVRFLEEYNLDVIGQLFFKKNQENRVTLFPVDFRFKNPAT